VQFMTLFSWHPDKGETPAPADLREAEFEMIRGLYTTPVWFDKSGFAVTREAPAQLWKPLRLTKSRKSSARFLSSAKATCSLR
jgi:hypothetical protein